MITPIEGCMPLGLYQQSTMGYLRCIKLGMPLRPIISSIGSVTHSTAKELARIIKLLVGGSSHHVKITWISYKA